MTKLQLFNLINQYIYENTNLEISATNVNNLLKDLVTFTDDNISVYFYDNESEFPAVGEVDKFYVVRSYQNNGNGSAIYTWDTINQFYYLTNAQPTNTPNIEQVLFSGNETQQDLIFKNVDDLVMVKISNESEQNGLIETFDVNGNISRNRPTGIEFIETSGSGWTAKYLLGSMELRDTSGLERFYADKYQFGFESLIGGFKSFIDYEGWKFRNDGNTFTSTLKFTFPTADREIFIPNNSGILALLSDIPSTLPPTGLAGGELSGTYPNPTLLNSAVLGKVLTGLSLVNNPIVSTDSILNAFGKLQGQIDETIKRGGNSFNAPFEIGTNDNFALNFETNAIIRASISNTGVFSIANLGGTLNRLVSADASGNLGINNTLTHTSLRFNIPNLNTAGVSPSLNQFLNLAQSGLSFQWDGNNTVSAWSRLSLTTNVNATVGNSTTLGGTLFNLSSGIGTPSASTLDGLGFNIIGRAGFFQPFDVLSNGGKLRLGCGDIGSTNQILIGRYNSFVNANFNTYALENNLSFYFPFDNTIRIETTATNRILVGNSVSASAKFYGDFDLINNRFNLIDSTNTRTYFRYDVTNRRLELGDFTNDSSPATTYQLKQFDSTGQNNLLGILYRDVNNLTKQALSVTRVNRVTNINGVPQTTQISYETRTVGLRTGYIKTLRNGNIATANGQVINMADNNEASLYTYQFNAGSNIINLPSASTCEGMKFRIMVSKTGGNVTINRIGTDQILIGQSINLAGSIIANSYVLNTSNIWYEYEFEAFNANGYTINGAVQTRFLWKMRLIEQYSR